MNHILSQRSSRAMCDALQKNFRPPPNSFRSQPPHVMDLVARIQALGVRYDEAKLTAVIQPRLTHNDAFERALHAMLMM